MDTPVIDVCSLGSFRLAIDGRPVVRWRAGRARDLLQFLLLRPNRVASRETLCAALWPEATGSGDSRGSLKVAVHALRRILDEHTRSAGMTDPPVRLVTCQEGYLLEVRQLRVDFHMFDDLIDRGHRAERDGRADEATARSRNEITFQIM